MASCDAHQMKRFLTKPKISEVVSEDKLDSIYNLLKVTGFVAENHLRVFDRQLEDHLILIHYLTPDPAVYHVRGIVIDTLEIEIVSSSFPYTDELTTDDISVIEGKISDYEITKAYEGTILRFFCGRHTGNWYLSTHRKINGRRSRWSGPPFGELFDSFWKDPKKLGETLNKRYCYTFLLSHMENRLVCNIPQSKLYFLGVFSGASYNSVSSKKCRGNIGTLINGDASIGKISDTIVNVISEFKEDSGLCLCIRKESMIVDTKEGLIEEITNIDWRECTGLLLTRFTNDKLECYKFSPEEYLQKRELRGSEPNFRLRYLQLRELQKEEEFRELFPVKKEYFDQIDKDLEKLPKYLRELYQERYKRGNFTRLPPEDHYILDNTYRGFDPQKSVISNLKDTLEDSNPRQLNALIKHMYEARKGEEDSVN